VSEIETNKWVSQYALFVRPVIYLFIPHPQLVSHVERLLPGGVGMAPASSTVGMTAFASMHAFSSASSSSSSSSSSSHVDVLAPHLRPAIQGFFRSIALGRDRSLQDILRLLTLWFKHGARADVEVCGWMVDKSRIAELLFAHLIREFFVCFCFNQTFFCMHSQCVVSKFPRLNYFCLLYFISSALRTFPISLPSGPPISSPPQAALVDGFNSISIDTWLDVIPQLIARIHTPQPPIRRLIHELLTRVGRAHPQVWVGGEIRDRL
jgi:hypothetical protein